jgi:hypothetical protein
MKHKHAELIKAWADGAEIEVKVNGGWDNAKRPSWAEFTEYRVKPKPNGIEYILESCANRFELSKGDLWEEAMADPSKVIVDGEVIRASQDKRKHLHERLDMWMDNNWEFE